MATMLARKRVLAAKIETTPGTAVALSASDAVFNVMTPAMTPNIEFSEREGQGGMSPLPGALGAYAGQCTFQIECTGVASGSPEWATTFLPACGMVGASDAYTPVSKAPGASGGPKTLTIGLYEDGLFKKLVGAAGNARFLFTAGRVAMVEFTFFGIWADPTDVAIITPSYPTPKLHRFASAALTLGSYTGATAPHLASLEINQNNQVVPLESQETEAGIKYFMVADRRYGGSMNPDAQLVATRDHHGIWKARTEQALSFTLGVGSGQQVAISAPKLQFRNVQPDIATKIQRDAIEFQLNGSDGGDADDEFEIDFAQP